MNAVISISGPACYRRTVPHEPQKASQALERTLANIRQSLAAEERRLSIMPTTFQPRRSFQATDRLSSPALAPVLSPRGPVPASADAHFGVLARRAAEGDHAARNALHAAFAPRLDHWVRRAQGAARRYSVDSAIESDDIAQEAFLVFADLPRTWNGQGSFSGYVIAYFPWRLSNAVRAMSERRQHRSLEAIPADMLADGSFAADEAMALLHVLVDGLPERLGRILLLRLEGDQTWVEIASQLGITKRTALRDWKQLLLQLRAAGLPG
jgi:RNA polymerase sigma factor (sigma-70 family)